MKKNMNYWLDLRLKIRNFFKKHKKKIIIIFIVWTCIIIINNYLKNKPEIIEPATTYKPHEPVINLTEKYVPEQYKQPIENLIYNYIEYCNNKDYESAYNLLSEDYKIRYCDNIETFKSYVDEAFATYKRYNIQNYSNLDNMYIYIVRILDDILSTGTTDEYSYIEDKFVIKPENGTLKISLNGYCGKENLNIEAEDDYMQIKITKKEMTYDKVTYNVEIKNKSRYFLVLADSTSYNEIQLVLPKEARTAKEIESNNFVLLPLDTFNGEFTFDKYIDDIQVATSLKFNSIRILPEYTGYDENAEKENENAIKLYSLAIDLISKQR